MQQQHIRTAAKQVFQRGQKIRLGHPVRLAGPPGHAAQAANDKAAVRGRLRLGIVIHTRERLEPGSPLRRQQIVIARHAKHGAELPAERLPYRKRIAAGASLARVGVQISA
ncbi:hypothetical protein D1872_299430 [compost metagenome]